MTAKSFAIHHRHFEPIMIPEPNKRLQLTATIGVVAASAWMAVEHTLNPDPFNAQARIDLYQHPIALAFVSLLPPAIIALPAYWIFGRMFVGRTVRFKVCKHCAENIKVAAKVCRYCGRDVQSNTSDEGSGSPIHLEGFDPALVSWMKRRHPNLTNEQIASKIKGSLAGVAPPEDEKRDAAP